MSWSSKQRDRMLTQHDRELDLAERQIQVNAVTVRLWEETTKAVGDVRRRLEALEQRLPEEVSA